MERSNHSSKVRHGDVGPPHSLSPESPGGVTLTGTSRAYFDGSHIIVDDLKFIDGHPAPTATSGGISDGVERPQL